MTHEIRRILWRHLVLAVVLVLVFLAVGSGPGGVALGSGAIGLSVWLYGTLFEVVVGGGRRRLAIVLLFAKLAAVLGLGWLAFASGRERPDPLGFALGVTCFPAAVVWEAVRGRKG